MFVKYLGSSASTDRLKQRPRVSRQTGVCRERRTKPGNTRVPARKRRDNPERTRQGVVAGEPSNRIRLAAAGGQMEQSTSGPKRRASYVGTAAALPSLPRTAANANYPPGIHFAPVNTLSAHWLRQPGEPKWQLPRRRRLAVGRNRGAADRFRNRSVALADGLSASGAAPRQEARQADGQRNAT